MSLWTYKFPGSTTSVFVQCSNSIGGKKSLKIYMGGGKSFSWTIEKGIGIGDIMPSPSVLFSVVPPWLLGEILVDRHLLEWKKSKSLDKSHGSRYTNEHYAEYIKIFIDASKVDNNRVGVAFIIPDFSVMLNKRVRNNLKVFTGKLLVILLSQKMERKCETK